MPLVLDVAAQGGDSQHDVSHLRPGPQGVIPTRQEFPFEQKTQGSIEAGKLADLVILDKNPVTVDPMTINKRVVLETIKEGKTVYSR